MQLRRNFVGTGIAEQRCWATGGLFLASESPQTSRDARGWDSAAATSVVCSEYRLVGHGFSPALAARTC